MGLIDTPFFADTRNRLQHVLNHLEQPAFVVAMLTLCAYPTPESTAHDFLDSRSIPTNCRAGGNAPLMEFPIRPAD